MKQYLLLSNLVVLLLFSTPILSQNQIAESDSNMTLLGNWATGPCQTVVDSGNIAYLGIGKYFEILDLSDISNPIVLGKLSMPAGLTSIVVRGNYAYVADYSEGIRIIDISDPAEPNEIGFFDTGNYAYDLTVVGNYVYVADFYDGLRIIDVSNPVEPSEVGFFDTQGYARSIFVDKNYAYIADDNDGLRIIDVSNPTNPFEVGFFDTDGTTFDVVVRGDSCYVADGFSGLRIFDISNPATPLETGHLITGGKAVSLKVKGKFVYVAANEELKIVDISSPSGPFLTGSFGTYDTAINLDVGINNNYVYIANFSFDLRIIDVTDPSNPFEVGSFYPGGLFSSIAFNNNYAYTNDGLGGAYFNDGLGEINIINLSNLQKPKKVGYIKSVFGYIRSVASDSNYLYAITDMDSLYIFNISVPDNPCPVSVSSIIDGSMIIKVKGNLAFIAFALSGASELGIFDVTDLTNPSKLSSFNLISIYIVNISIQNNFVFLSTSNGLRIIDISNPSQPLEVGNIYEGSRINAIVKDNSAYVSTVDGLHVVDISNPANPTEIGYFESWIVHNYSQEITISENYAFVSSDSGITMLDISSPSNLVKKGYFNTVFFNLTAYKSHIFGLNGSGLYILQNDLLTDINFEALGSPKNFTLSQNYPNPFNPSTTISYSLPQSGFVKLNVYDALGREIATLVNEKQQSGNYSVQFNAENLSSGVYFYKLSAGNFIAVKKMMILK